MHMRAILIGLTLLATSATAHAAGNSGTAVSVATLASVSGKGGKRTLVKGMDVERGETVITNRSGLAQFQFEDGTRIVVGPNSKLLIEQYLLASDGTARKFTVNAISGTFRFLSGNSRKEAYAIRTPTATLGIRGTIFDLTVDLNGQTDVLLHEGAARLCGTDRRCVELEDDCELGTTGRVRRTRIVEDGNDQADAIRERFPFVRRQRALMRDFRVDTRSCADTRRAAIPDERPRTVPRPPEQPQQAALPPAPPPAEPPAEPPASPISAIPAMAAPWAMPEPTPAGPRANRASAMATTIRAIAAMPATAAMAAGATAVEAKAS